MPFTPSILKEDFKKFIKDPKNLNAKFMSMAFNTTRSGKKIWEQLFIHQIIQRGHKS